MDRLTCFVASPIGKDGSGSRTRADDVFDFLIEPALDRYGFDVKRADHSSRGTDIRDDMVSSLRESDLCVVVMTDMNPNVMFEFGIRFETGKPFVVLMDESQRQVVPFDARTLRIIYYDGSFQNPRSTRDTQRAIQQAVDGFIEAGINRTTKASFESIADSLNRVERKLESLLKREVRSAVAAPAPSQPAIEQVLNPREAFLAARLQGDVARMERLLPLIEPRVDFVQFYDFYVQIVAAQGSEYAGQLLSQNMERFMAVAPNAKAKIDYLGCFVSYCMRRNKEGEELERVVSIIEEALDDDALTDPQRAALHCQVNRLLYGQYSNTGDEAYLIAAVRSLEQSIAYDPHDASYHYNMALCRRELGQIEEAQESILRCLDLDGADDSDHLALACQIFAATGNAELAPTLERLREANPDKYAITRADLEARSSKG